MERRVTVHLNKLVANNVARDMKDKGHNPTIRDLDNDEYAQALLQKMLEEVNELIAEPASSKELAQVLLVIEEYAKHRGLLLADLDRLVKQCRADKGGFDERQYVETIELNPDDPWLDYFRADDRYMIE